MPRPERHYTLFGRSLSTIRGKKKTAGTIPIHGVAAFRSAQRAQDRQKGENVRLARHFNPQFLLYLGEVLLFVLVFALALEMLAVARRKARDLAVRPRSRGIFYLAIPAVLASLLLAWLLLR